LQDAILQVPNLFQPEQLPINLFQIERHLLLEPLRKLHPQALQAIPANLTQPETVNGRNYREYIQQSIRDRY
jgi:hypothetical protein